MRRLLNLIISGFVLWISTLIFPEQVQIENFGTLAIATILLWLINFAIAALGMLITAGGLIFESCSWSILGFVIIIFSKVLSLWALDAWLPGFTIHGFWLKLLIAFACSFFAIGEPSSQNNDPPQLTFGSQTSKSLRPCRGFISSYLYYICTKSAVSRL